MTAALLSEEGTSHIDAKVVQPIVSRSTSEWVEDYTNLGSMKPARLVEPQVSLLSFPFGSFLSRPPAPIRLRT